MAKGEPLLKSSSRIKRNGIPLIGTLLAVLLILELLAAVVLSLRLSGLTYSRGLRISLSAGGPKSILSILTAGESGSSKKNDFKVSDADTVWTTNTKVNIFETAYGNSKSGVVVKSGNGDKVIAPGTSNSYRFTIDNTGKYSLDYELSFVSEQHGYTRSVPVEARISDQSGKYLFGTETSWLGIADIDQAKDEATLQANESKTYILEWRWLLDGNDDFDNFLGNATVENPVTLTVGINTTAEVTEGSDVDPYGPGGRNAWALLNLICMVLTLIIGVYEFVLVLSAKKERKKCEEYPDYVETVYYTRRLKRRKSKLWDLLPLAASVIVFFLTEDLTKPMVWYDKWTILMVIILLISITIALLTRLRKLLDEIRDVLGDEYFEKAGAKTESEGAAGVPESGPDDDGPDA